MRAYQLGLRIAARTPEPLWRSLAHPAAWLVALRPPSPVRAWQANAAVVLGRRPSRRESAAALRSWARNLMESVQLPRWSAGRIDATVRISEQDLARLDALHARRGTDEQDRGTGGVVIALPHMGSWDMAGAWACHRGMLVSTVAEELDEQEFAVFLQAREALGMKVYGHRDRSAVARLVADQRAGRVVCLVSERNLGAGGTSVEWPTASGVQQVRMPSGAAHVALRTGATLVGAASRYEGRAMRLVISEPILPDADASGDGQAAAMTQQLATFFAGQVREQPADWHMLQPFFGRTSSSARRG